MPSRTQGLSLITALGLGVLTHFLSRLVLAVWPQLVVYNPNVIFGFLGQPWFVFGVVVIGLVLVGRIWLGGLEEQRIFWGVVLVLAGALANIIDRFVFGAVIDYLPFWHWWTFNLADIEIVLGAVLLSFEGLGEKKNRPIPH